MAPSSQGLYNPAFEHDACGVAMVADMHGRRSRDIVDKAITALVNLEHRGAQGAEPQHRRRRRHPAAGSRRVPPRRCRLRAARGRQLRHRHRVPAAVVQGRRRGLRGRREDRRGRGPEGARLARGPDRRLVARRAGPRRDADVPADVHRAAPPGMDLERRAYVVRKRAEHELGTKGPGQDGPGRETVYFPSLSGQTFVYKGMLTTPQLQGVLPGPAGRAADQRARHRALALLHQHVPVVAAGPPVPARRPQR